MSIKNIISYFHTEKGLQVRMTLWVAGTVLTVATIVMLIASTILQQRYEEEVNSQLEKDIDNTVRIINQRMMRAEYITYTAASIIGNNLHNYNSKELEAVVYGLMKDVVCVDVVSLTLTDGDESNTTNYVTYNSMENDKRTLVPLPPFKMDMRNDSSWIASYHQKLNIWYPSFKPNEHSEDALQCFSVPVYSPDSVCHGMLCTMIMERFITLLVNEHNTRPDVTITIYNLHGDRITKTKDKTSNLSEDKVLRVERLVDRLKWRMVFSINKSVITEKMNRVLLTMLLSMIILLISLVLSITLTIRYVARPFVRNQRLTSEAKALMERELKIAAGTQRQLVPHHFPPFPDRDEISLQACLHPAREVGGDLYDYFIDQDTLYFCIGDVSGKGVPASLLMAATHYLFRSVASIMPMSEAVQQINRTLAIDNERCNFVTFLFGKLNLNTRTLEYTNAGHNTPIFIHNGKPEYFAESDSTPLGIWDEAEYPTHTMQLSKGDTILLYTDGVTEAMNPQGEEIGEETILRCVEQNSTKECEAIIASILQSVKHHAGTAKQSDDITMLCIKINK